MERVKQESRARGTPFRQTVNELLRSALLNKGQQELKKFKVEPFRMGYRQDLDYDDIEGLVEYLEGPYHR